jgi:cobalt-zinc-cadmium efflux system membrane fusion protein
MRKIYILMASCAIMAGCGSNSGKTAEEHEADHAHESEEHSHSDEIVIEPERQATLGIKADTVRFQEFCEVIPTSGEIISANGDEATVVATTSGTVSLSNIAEGSAVSKGGKIATISSKGLGEGDRLAKAKIAYETAKKEYERDEALLKDNIVSQSHYDQSKMAYENAKAEYDALIAGGVSDKGVVVSSPIGGYVKSLVASQGQYVETGQPIAVVSQNRRLQLRADVSEKYYDKIAQITDATFRTSYGNETYSLKDLGGRLLSHGRASSGDYYIPVTFEFDNRGNIVPGSYVEIFLKTKPISNAIVVPVDAVVEDQGVHYVFVQLDEDCFDKREVTLGQSDGISVPILSGVKDGEMVVTKGAIKVKLASVSAVPAGHNHNH